MEVNQYWSPWLYGKETAFLSGFLFFFFCLTVERNVSIGREINRRLGLASTMNIQCPDKAGLEEQPSRSGDKSPGL